MARLIERQRRRNQQLQAAQQQAAERGEARHHEIDQRFETIEVNTGKIAVLEDQVAQLTARIAAHETAPAGKAHR